MLMPACGIRRSAVAIIGGAVLGGGLLGAAQQLPRPVQFRSSTDVVLLDVSVLDKTRRPVRGLKASDFSVFEDGAPQSVVAFDAVDLPETTVPAAKWMGRASHDVQSNRMPDGRLVLIYLDERQVYGFGLRTAREVGHAIIDQLSPNDVAAVAFAVNYRGAQEFTTDRGRLHQAVDTFLPRDVGPPALSVSPMVSALNGLVEHLGAIPERRKVIVYIGRGEAYDLESLATTRTVCGKMCTQPETFRTIYVRQQYHSLMDLFAAAQRSNVTLYAVDPTGLVSEPDNWGERAYREFLRIIADNTGGRAVVSTNAPVSDVPGILRENASYYLLGIQRPDAKADGKFRRLQVKVNRPNVEVRSRTGYLEPKTASTGTTASRAEAESAGRLIPASDLAIGLWAEPVASDSSGSHPVAMAIGLELERRDAPEIEHLSAAYSILDMNGREQASGRRDLAVTAGEMGVGALRTQVLAAANLPPGRYDVRVFVHSAERNRRGSLVGDVVVPDFARATLSTSGVVVAERPEPMSVPGRALLDVLSIRPTTSRAFAASADVSASVRIYQGGKNPPELAPLYTQPVTVKAVILDALDRAAFEETQRFETDAILKRGFAEYRLALPLSRLAAGPYLLRLEAKRASAAPVIREVRFSVK